MITLQQVRKQYGTTLALDDISLTIACGEFFVLVGQSGSGKTTLLKMLNRLIEPDSGTILVGGETSARNLCAPCASIPVMSCSTLHSSPT